MRAKRIVSVILVILLIGLAGVPLNIIKSISLLDKVYAASASGTLTFSIQTVTTGGRYAPRNVGAIWIEDSSGKFVKSLNVWAMSQKRWLSKWNASSGGNTVDAITSATISTHVVHTVTWNGTDVNGSVAPDGNYKVCIEFTEANSAGPNVSVNFSKGTTEQHLTPSLGSNFISAKLDFVPQTTPTPTKTPSPTVTQISSVVPTPTITVTNIYGDVSNDGSVNSIDFAYLRLYLLGVSNPSHPNWNVVGDLNEDGNINSIDYAVLRSFLLGNIYTLPYKPATF